jgi:hypothetical protein
MYFVLDGQLLVEEMEIQWDYDPANSIIKTQQKGFAGVTPGAGGFNVSVNSAVPRAGTEVDYVSLVANRTAVEGIVVSGGKKLVSKGFIMKLGGKGGVNQDTTVSFDYSGSEPEEMT